MLNLALSCRDWERAVPWQLSAAVNSQFNWISPTLSWSIIFGWIQFPNVLSRISVSMFPRDNPLAIFPCNVFLWWILVAQDKKLVGVKGKKKKKKKDSNKIWALPINHFQPDWNERHRVCGTIIKDSQPKRGTTGTKHHADETQSLVTELTQQVLTDGLLCATCLSRCEGYINR